MPRGVKKDKTTPDKRSKTSAENLSKARREMRDLVRKGRSKREKIVMFSTPSSSDDDEEEETRGYSSEPEYNATPATPPVDQSKIMEEFKAQLKDQFERERQERDQALKELRDSFETFKTAQKEKPKEEPKKPAPDYTKAMAERMLLKF